MKKYNHTFLFLIVFNSLVGNAQLSGEALYATKINRHMTLPKTESGEKMKDWIPEFQEFNNQLLFTEKQTVYKNIHEEIPPNLSDADKNYYWYNRDIAPPEEIIFCDITKSTTAAKKELLGKTFLIIDSLKSANWKITGEQMELAGMNCLKASFIQEEGDSTTIEVWFTPEIPISSGPDGYGGLPGLILYVNKNNGEVVISLKSLIKREIRDSEIIEPKKGKKMTFEEFDRLKQKKKEQQEERSY